MSGSSGGSAGDSAAEAANFEDYNTSSKTTAGSSGHPTMSGDSNQTDWSETDDYESDFSDVQSSAPDTYSAPSSDSYSGLDNEQAREMEAQHYQSWKEETQQPQYDGTEDLETQREIDRDFAIKKGLITVDSQGNVSDGPNVRNSKALLLIEMIQVYNNKI